MPRIKVTGFLEVEEDEYDPGPLGPLTEEASLRATLSLGLDDVEFELDEEEET